MSTTFALYQDLMTRIKPDEFADSFIAPILQDECKQPEEIEASVQYSWDEFKEKLDEIDALAQKVDETETVNKDLQWSVAAPAADAAIAVASATQRSSEAMNYVARICRAVFAEFGLQLKLSQMEQYDLYRNAYDASYADEFKDDVYLVLTNAEVEVQNPSD